jgi:hypothetical protein
MTGKPKDPLNEVLTAKEAEQLYGLKPGTVRRACWEKRIEARKSSGTWLVTRSEMERKYKKERTMSNANLNLKYASESFRKAAAINGVWSGKYEARYGGEGPDAIVGVVYNRNHPEGVEITAGEEDHANAYTWAEIKADR